MHLSNGLYSQDEPENSRVDAPEVINISSDLENSPPKKKRRVIRKIPFSHPLAHLDSHFLLKKQQHTSRRQTRSAGSEELMAGLSNSSAPKKRPTEVSFTCLVFNNFVLQSYPYLKNYNLSRTRPLRLAIQRPLSDLQ